MSSLLQGLDQHETYMNEFRNIAIEYSLAYIENPLSPMTREKMKELLNIGVKAVTVKPITMDIDPLDLTLDIEMIDFLCNLMAELTLNEFETIFPINNIIEQELQNMDSTHSHIWKLQTSSVGIPIGVNIHSFLVNYGNNDIIMFNFVKNQIMKNKQMLNSVPA